MCELALRSVGRSSVVGRQFSGDSEQLIVTSAYRMTVTGKNVRSQNVHESESLLTHLDNAVSAWTECHFIACSLCGTLTKSPRTESLILKDSDRTKCPSLWWDRAGGLCPVFSLCMAPSMIKIGPTHQSANLAPDIFHCCNKTELAKKQRSSPAWPC